MKESVRLFKIAAIITVVPLLSAWSTMNIVRMEDVRRRLRMQDLALPIAAHLTMDLRWPMLMRERVSFWN